VSLRQFFEIPPPRTLARAPDRATRRQLRRLANDGRGAEIVIVALVVAVFAIAMARGADWWIVAGMTVVSALVAGPFLFFFELARRRNQRLVYGGTLVEGHAREVNECMVPGYHGRDARGQEVVIEFELVDQPATCHALIPDGYQGGEIAEVGATVSLVAHPNGEDVLILGDGWQLIAARGE
jgi:hypothetical protein